MQYVFFKKRYIYVFIRHNWYTIREKIERNMYNI